jgi:hypothetical protein
MWTIVRGVSVKRDRNSNVEITGYAYHTTWIKIKLFFQLAWWFCKILRLFFGHKWGKRIASTMTIILWTFSARRPWNSQLVNTYCTLIMILIVVFLCLKLVDFQNNKEVLVNINVNKQWLEKVDLRDSYNL